ncbi:hypothetical protein AAVH_05189 [Aphelenchoides avenae]|nr:hypothetical protein AAVH_05189 [Aphelenchus avenae]
MELHQEPVSPDDIGFAPAGRDRKPYRKRSKFALPTESTLDNTATTADEEDNGSPLPYRRFPFLDDEAAAKRIADLNQQKNSFGTSGGTRHKRHAIVDSVNAANFQVSVRGGFGVRMWANAQGQSNPLNTWRQSGQHSVNYSERVSGLRRRVPPVVPQSADATLSHDNSEATEVEVEGPKPPDDGDDQPRGLHVLEADGSASNDSHAEADRGGAVVEQKAGDCGFTVVDRSQEFANTVSKFGRHTPSDVLQTADSMANRASGAAEVQTSDAKPQEEGDAQPPSADNFQDNASSVTGQEGFVNGYPHSNETTEGSAQSQCATPDPDAADVAGLHQNEGVGIIAMLVGFVTFMLMWILSRVRSTGQRIARCLKSIWPIASHAQPSVNDTTEQASGEGVAASDEVSSLLGSLVANSSGTEASSQNREEIKQESEPEDSKPFGAVDENKQESHALYMSGIVFAVASRAAVGISTEELQLILCAQYGRDVSPLTEAGVDVPLKEYILRFIRSVRVCDGVNGQEMCVLVKNL